MSNDKPITVADLDNFMKYIESHEHLYDDFNVAMAKTILGAFLVYLKGQLRREIQSLKDGLDTNAVDAAKIAWCEETEDNIMQAIAHHKQQWELEAGIRELDYADEMVGKYGFGEHFELRRAELVAQLSNTKQEPRP